MESELFWLFHSHLVSRALSALPTLASGQGLIPVSWRVVDHKGGVHKVLPVADALLGLVEPLAFGFQNAP
jgi:hypothetical protein